MPNTLTYFPVIGSWQDLNISAGDGNPDPEVQMISALVDFVPRLPKGYTFEVDDLLIRPATNEVRRVRINGGSSAGTFTLAFAGSDPSDSIARMATAGVVQTRLQALSTIGSNNVTVAGPNGGPWDVTFTGALANTAIANVGVLSGDPTNLVGGSADQVVIQIITTGGPIVSRDTSVHLDKFTARITNGLLVTPATPNDIPGVSLLANTALLNYKDHKKDPPEDLDLFYDVRFYNVIVGGGAGTLINFAFKAPTTNTEVNLTDPTFERLTYAG